MAVRTGVVRNQAVAELVLVLAAYSVELVSETRPTLLLLSCKQDTRAV